MLLEHLQISVLEIIQGNVGKESARKIEEHGYEVKKKIEI
jgi:hypothetical protein